MTWIRKELSLSGKMDPQGMCPSCGADLVPAMRHKARECVYLCSRKKCCFEKSPVPPSSKLYAGPKKNA